MAYYQNPAMNSRNIVIGNGWNDPGKGVGQPDGANGYDPTGRYKAAGYVWDPIKGWVESPSYAGKQKADYTNGYLNNVPSLSGLMGAFGSSLSGSSGSGSSGSGGFEGYGGAQGPPSGIGGGGTGSNATLTLGAPDYKAATEATFNAAKDRAAQQSRASITALNGELGAAGMMGGGAQVQGTRDIIQNAGQYVSDVNRQATSDEARGMADFAKTGYEGGISQRGQDIGQQTAYRGQDVAWADAQARLALQKQQQQFQMLSLILQGLGGGKNGLAY